MMHKTSLTVLIAFTLVTVPVGTASSTPTKTEETLETTASRYVELANQSDALYNLFGKTKAELRSKFARSTSHPTGQWSADDTEYSIPLPGNVGVHYTKYIFSFDKNGQVNSITMSQSGWEGMARSKYKTREQIIKETMKRLSPLIETSKDAATPIYRSIPKDQLPTARINLYATRGTFSLLLGDKSSGLKDIATSERLRTEFGVEPITQLKFTDLLPHP